MATLTPEFRTTGVDWLISISDASNLLDGLLAIAICIFFAAVTAAQLLLRVDELTVEWFEQLLIISIYNTKSFFPFPFPFFSRDIVRAKSDFCFLGVFCAL